MSDEKRFPVIEIFGPTIAGEGAVIGQRTLFVRFGGCDYRCAMCDSMHAVDPQQIKKNATYMTAQEISIEVLRLAKLWYCGWVTISGGNPAMHNLAEVVEELHAHVGVSVETQGTLAPDWLGHCDYIAVSPKGPGMGEKFEPAKFTAFIDKFESHQGLYVKVPIFDARDLEFASMIAEMAPRQYITDRFYLSVGNPFPPGTLVVEDRDRDHWASIEHLKAILYDLREYPALRMARLLPQLHYLVWGNDQGH